MQRSSEQIKSEQKLKSLAAQIERETRHIMIAMQEVADELDTILSASNKTFTVTRKNKTYDFFVPSNLEEKKQQDKLRTTLIKHLVNDAVSSHKWDIILSFTQGMNPDLFQIEKISREEIVAAPVGKDGRPPATALNEDRVYVKWQRDHDVPFETDVIGEHK